MPVTLARAAMSRIAKHGLNVAPLEAYGFLMGTGRPLVAYCSLPVGKTSRWFDTSDRFALLPAALESAVRVAESVELEVIGVYHTDYDGHPDFPGSRISPRDQVPDIFRDRLLVILSTQGHELLFMPGVYLYAKENGWQEQEFRKTPFRVETPRLNPRRILRQWRLLWNAVDLSNNADTELKRLGWQ